MGRVNTAEEETSSLARKLRALEEQYPRQKGTAEPDFAVLSMEDRREYLNLLSELTAATRNYRRWSTSARGAEEAILRGERDLSAIIKAERTYADNK